MAIESSGIEPPSRPRSRGGFMSALVFLLAVTAFGVSGYLYWRLVWNDSNAAEARRISELGATLARQTAGIADEVTRQVDREVGAEIQTIRGQTQGIDQRLGAMEAAVANLLTAPAREVPASVDDWKVAEAGYLLRIADQRLRLHPDGNDVKAALELLATADRLLAATAGAGFHAVREGIARERLALEAAGDGVDVQGVYVAIEALKDSLDDALGPVQPGPAPAESAESSNPTTQSPWDAFVDRLTELARVRRIDPDSIQPLPEAEERAFVERRLLLSLDQAQLALLRREQVVYENSLRRVREQVAGAGTHGSPAREAFVAALDPLLAIKVDPVLPDLGPLVRAFESSEAAVVEQP